MQNKKQDENTSKFAAVLKKIFVHNIGWKLLSIASAAIIWALVAGL